VRARASSSIKEEWRISLERGRGKGGGQRSGGDRGQRTEDRGQRTEDRGQGTVEAGKQGRGGNRVRGSGGTRERIFNIQQSNIQSSREPGATDPDLLQSRDGWTGREREAPRSEIRGPAIDHRPPTTNHQPPGSGAGTDGNEEGKEEDTGGKLSKSGERRGAEVKRDEIITKMVIIRNKWP